MVLTSPCHTKPMPVGREKFFACRIANIEWPSRFYFIVINMYIHAYNSLLNTEP